MKIKVGKSYKVRIPKFIGVTKVHIDNIMTNPKYEDNPKFLDSAFDLVTYRVWNRRRQGWTWCVDMYYVFCLWNDWEYEK